MQDTFIIKVLSICDYGQLNIKLPQREYRIHALQDNYNRKWFKTAIIPRNTGEKKNTPTDDSSFDWGILH